MTGLRAVDRHPISKKDVRRVKYDNPEVWAWLGDSYLGHSESEGLTITLDVMTPAGKATAKHEDFIIKLHGKFLVVRNRTFQQTFRQVD